MQDEKCPVGTVGVGKTTGGEENQGEGLTYSVVFRGPQGSTREHPPMAEPFADVPGAFHPQRAGTRPLPTSLSLSRPQLPLCHFRVAPRQELLQSPERLWAKQLWRWVRGPSHPRGATDGSFPCSSSGYTHGQPSRGPRGGQCQVCPFSVPSIILPPPTHKETLRKVVSAHL